MTEFEIIERYFHRESSDPAIVVGVGDDAAVLEVQTAMAISVDTLVEGVHFLVGMSPAALGHRVLAVNLSDLAAMGATPRWCTLALSLPGADEAWLDGFARGFFELAQQHGVSLIGGNLARGPLSATVQIMGGVAPEGAVLRSRAAPGDDLYVTGTLGDASVGLELLRDVQPDQSPALEYLTRRFECPQPRVELGATLPGLASAMVDLSDGLVGDLGHLCAASGCAAVVDVDEIPMSRELLGVCDWDRALTHALCGGDDYELCFAAPPGAAGKIREAALATGTAVQRIGCMGDGTDIEWRREGAPFTAPAAAYSHFA